MTFLPELQGRLAGLVVLLPSDVLEPAEYAERDEQGRRKAKGERGLQRYFRDVAPRGYVQLRHNLGILSDGLTDTGLLYVDVIAPDLALAEALAHQVRARIGSLPVAPTRFTLQGQETDEQPDFCRLILNFQTRSIGV